MGTPGRPSQTSMPVLGALAVRTGGVEVDKVDAAATLELIEPDELA